MRRRLLALLLPLLALGCAQAASQVMGVATWKCAPEVRKLTS